MGVLGCINFETTAVKQSISLGFRIITGGHQIFHDIVGQCIYKVCIH